jgi:hypothetical protein
MRQDVDLLVVDCPPGSHLEGPATIDDEPILFRNLPFAVVRHAGERPDALPVVSMLELYPAPRLLLLLGLDWLIGRQVDVINLSLGFTDPFDPDEPVQIATRTAAERQMVVVVAAGNDGPGQGTLQELAQPDWVLAVGATDPQGQLLKRSSRGWPDGPMPAVVSDGTDDVEPPMEPGTSFAAPRVAALAALVRRCLELSRSDLIAATEGRWGLETDWILLPRVGIADTGFDPNEVRIARGALSQQMSELGQDRVRLSREDAERDWYVSVVDWLRAHQLPCQVAITPKEIRLTFALIARPVANAKPWEVGAGFIDVGQVELLLADLTPSRWLSVFCPVAITEETRSPLQDLDATLGPLWDTVRIKVFKDLFWTGIQLFIARVVEPEGHKIERNGGSNGR